MSIRVVDFVRHEAPPILATFAIYIPAWGLKLTGLRWIEKDGKRFFSLPAKRMEATGEWIPYAVFDREQMRALRKAVDTALQEVASETE